MKRMTKLGAVLIAGLALAMVGCADDGGDGNTTTPDATGDTGGDAMGDADTGPTDPCVPNPCTPKAATCEGEVYTIWDSECVADETETDGYRCEDTKKTETDCTTQTKAAECIASKATTYLAGTCSATAAGGCAYAKDQETDCSTDGGLCISGACQAVGGGPGDYTFSEHASVVSSLAIADETAPCCFDFGGPDDGMDNALGALLSALGPLLGDTDVNGVLAEAIADGSVTLIFEQNDLADAANPAGDGTLGMTGFIGTGWSTPEDVAAGIGVFSIDPASFAVDGDGAATDIPQIQFGSASIASGVLTAGPAEFTLTFPLGEIALVAKVSNTRVEASVENGADDKGLATTADGKLGGVVKMQDLYGALNGFIAAQCSCLGLGTDPLVQLTEEGKLDDPACNPDADDSGCDATADPDGICGTVAGFCPVAATVLGNAADIDLDGDEENGGEAMSIGLWFNLVSARVCGIDGAAGCPCVETTDCTSGTCTDSVCE